jgi:hypothetical protein
MVNLCGMLRGAEVPRAQIKPIPYRAVAGRSPRTVSAGSEIYVTVLSGCPRQDDPARRRGLEQRRDCGELAYSARNREPVAKTLLRGASGGVGRSGSPRPTPGFFPQTWSSRSRLWRVNCRQPTTCRCRASASQIWLATPDSLDWSPPSATVLCGAGLTRMRSDPGSIAAGSFPVMPSSRSNPSLTVPTDMTRKTCDETRC